MSQTVICMKWGTRYGPDYVNRLYSMVMRNTRAGAVHLLY